MMTELESLGSIRGAIVGAFLLLAAAWGAGGLLAGLPQTGRRYLCDTALLRIAVGLNLVATAGVILGQLKLLAGGRSLWLLAALSLPAAIDAWGWWRGRRSLPAISRPTVSRRRAARHWSWGYAAAGLLALIALGPGLCYPTGWDELVYHSELPRRWLADGWPAVYRDLPYSGFPSAGEILFWLAGPIEGVILPRLLVWLCWIIGLVLLNRLLRLRSGSALALTLIFAASGTMLMISADCYVESLLLMNVAGLVLAIIRPGNRETSPRLRVGLVPDRVRSMRQAATLGVLAGGAAAVKLTGGAVLLVPCLWYASEVWRQPAAAAERMRALALYLAVAGAVCLPFYVRPWLATGNPCYPYFAAWFTDDTATIEMSRYHHAIGAKFGVPPGFNVSTLAALVNAPLLMPLEYELYDGSFGWQMPILIVLAAVALASASRRRWRPIVIWPAAGGVWLYLFWFFTAQQARFAIPAMLLAVYLAALGLRRLHGPRRRWLLLLLVLVALASAPWRNAGHYVGSWLTAVGVVSRTDYVRIGTSPDAHENLYMQLLEAIDEHTPADARVMLLFEHRGFYAPRSHLIGTPFFQEANFTPAERFDTPDRIMEVLRRERITHVVMTNAPGGPDYVSGWVERLEPFLSALGRCSQEGRLRGVWASQPERYVLMEVPPDWRR